MSHFLFMFRLNLTSCTSSATSTMTKITHVTVDYNDNAIITVPRDEYATSSISTTQKNKEQ